MMVMMLQQCIEYYYCYVILTAYNVHVHVNNTSIRHVCVHPFLRMGSDTPIASPVADGMVVWGARLRNRGSSLVEYCDHQFMTKRSVPTYCLYSDWQCLGVRTISMRRAAQ